MSTATKRARTKIAGRTREFLVRLSRGGRALRVWNQRCSWARPILGYYWDDDTFTRIPKNLVECQLELGHVELVEVDDRGQGRLALTELGRRAL